MKAGACFRFALILLTGLLSQAGPAQQSAVSQSPVFEIELPELSLSPTSSRELVIPSPNITTIVAHILNPHAERIDYGQIFTKINGESSGPIQTIVQAERGKRVQLQLKRLPGFELIPGRNTVEVWATNRLGRAFYSAFVIRTATENRNQDFRYEVKTAGQSLRQTPPELLLHEPEHAILLPSSRRNRIVRFTGVATAASKVDRVLIAGIAVALKRGVEGERRLGLAYEENRVTFDFNYMVSAADSSVAVEAIDAAGNRTTLTVPVFVGGRTAAEFRGRKYALIIGISNFLNNSAGVTNLQYADRDARAVYEFLQSSEGGRFSRENMLLLLNNQATLAAIKGALSEFIARPGADDLLFLFLATHGLPDPRRQQDLYFIAHDTHPARMADTGLPMRDFDAAVRQKVAARRLVMLFDACYSAGLINSGGELARGGNNLVNLYLEKMLYREEGAAVLTSSDVNEESVEAPKWGGGHGVFTYFLLDGLRGNADANLDRLVTVDELFKFVRHRVRTETEFRQNPRMSVASGQDLTLATVAARQSGSGNRKRVK